MEKNKKLIRDFVREVWNNKRIHEIPKYIDKKYVAHLLRSHNVLRGIEGVKNNVLTSHNSSQKFKIKIDNMFAEKNKVISLITLQRGNKILKELIIHKISNNKIVEAWSIGGDWKTR